MSSTMSRRALLRGAAGLLGTLGAASLLSACGSSTPAAKPAETKPAESKPAEAAKPAAPAAQPAATAAPAKPAEAAKPAESKPAAAAPAVSKKLGGEIRLHLRTGPEEDTMKAVLPKFTEDTGVQVKLETFPTDEYFVKVSTLMAGGTAGDVMWSIFRDTPRWAHNKVIMPLDDLAKAANTDLSAYWPAAVEAAKYQGALYALPFKLHPGPTALYYNVNYVNEAGIKMPEKQMPSWDELLKIAKALTKDGRFGFQMPLTPNTTNTLQGVNMYLRSWGTDVYSEDGKKTNLNDPKAKEAITFMYKLMHEEKVAVTAKDFTTSGDDLMIAGRSAMLQAASSTKSIPTKIGGKFEVKNLLMPPGPSGIVGTQAITDHIVVNAKTQNKEAAWELCKLLCGKEVGVRLGGGTGGTASGTTGAMIEVFNDPSIMANPLHPIFIDLVKNAVPPRLPANLREQEVATALHQTLQPVFLGERKPDDAFFTELSAAVQGVLDRPMA
jgi:ABC-type glycerol-3-phosphate transport system substrate-binding protein